MNEANKITTQEEIRQALAKHLKRGWILTAQVADEKYGCKSLKQRIYDLRQRGMKIKAVPCPDNPKRKAYRIDR